MIFITTVINKATKDTFLGERKRSANVPRYGCAKIENNGAAEVISEICCALK